MALAGTTGAANDARQEAHLASRIEPRAPVAQWIEQRFPKPRVGGSSPSRGATIVPGKSVAGRSYSLSGRPGSPGPGICRGA